MNLLVGIYFSNLLIGRKCPMKRVLKLLNHSEVNESTENILKYLKTERLREEILSKSDEPLVEVLNFFESQKVKDLEPKFYNLLILPSFIKEGKHLMAIDYYEINKIPITYLTIKMFISIYFPLKKFTEVFEVYSKIKDEKEKKETQKLIINELIKINAPLNIRRIFITEMQKNRVGIPKQTLQKHIIYKYLAKNLKINTKNKLKDFLFMMMHLYKNQEMEKFLELLQNYSMNLHPSIKVLLYRYLIYYYLKNNDINLAFKFYLEIKNNLKLNLGIISDFFNKKEVFLNHKMVYHRIIEDLVKYPNKRLGNMNMILMAGLRENPRFIFENYQKYFLKYGKKIASSTYYCIIDGLLQKQRLKEALFVMGQMLKDFIPFDKVFYEIIIYFSKYYRSKKECIVEILMLFKKYKGVMRKHYKIVILEILQELRIKNYKNLLD